jgi:hypothetical protein
MTWPGPSSRRLEEDGGKEGSKKQGTAPDAPMDPTGVDGDSAAARGSGGGGGGGTGAGRWAVGAVCGGLVYYHCAVRRASAVSLAADVLLVLLCSLSILGLLFRHLHIS